MYWSKTHNRLNTVTKKTGTVAVLSIAPAHHAHPNWKYQINGQSKALQCSHGPQTVLFHDSAVKTVNSAGY